MSDFDITSARETPLQRHQFNEALRQARREESLLPPHGVESAPASTWVLRQRRALDAQSRRRAAVLDWASSAAATVLGVLGLLVPNVAVSVACIGVAVISAGILIGSLVRGAL